MRFFSYILLAVFFVACDTAPPPPVNNASPGAPAPVPAYRFPKTIDSLWGVARDGSLPDSTQLEALNIISFTLRKSDPDSGIVVADQLIARARKSKDKKWEAYGFNAKASNYYNKSAYDSALTNHAEALRIRRETGDRKTEAQSLGNMGLVYERKLDYVKAIDLYLQSLGIKEELHDSLGMSNSYGNIGNIFMRMGQNAQALDYMKKCYAIKIRVADTAGIALVDVNLANVYLQLGDTNNALTEYNKALDLWTKIGDRKGQALTLNNLGSLYQDHNEDDKAFDAFQRSLEIRKTLNDPNGIALSQGNISIIYLRRGDFVNAEKSAREALLIADTLHDPSIGKEALETMSLIAAKRGDAKMELFYYREFIRIRDSALAVDAEKDIARKEIGFEYSKRAAEDSVRNSEAQKVKDAEIATGKLQLEKEEQERYVLYGGLVLVVAFSVFAWNRFRVTRKQKGIIELQKSEVESQKRIIEEKQKEVIDSINYARRLQLAILPPDEQFSNVGNDRFILYKPKDIVAGDFYFLEHVGDTVFVAAADSTGHGVPGALVSVVCSNALTRAVREMGITQPGQILDKATELILETFSKSGAEVKDGMDISLCAVNKNTNRIHWSGAHNSLWIVRNGELHVVDANKQPVGLHMNRVPFTTHEIEVQAGDMLYLLTDGYADQFGGEKGKKFKSAALKKLLVTCATKSCVQQKSQLETSFNEWKSNFEQVDDVCIIGIRL